LRHQEKDCLNAGTLPEIVDGDRIVVHYVYMDTNKGNKMTNQELQKHLIKYANQDLTTARKGPMAVCQTKIGAIHMEYNRELKVYVVNGQEMKKAQAVELLVSNYVVTFEGE